MTPAREAIELIRCLVDDGLHALDHDRSGDVAERVRDRELLWMLAQQLDQRLQAARREPESVEPSAFEPYLIAELQALGGGDDRWEPPRVYGDLRAVPGMDA